MTAGPPKFPWSDEQIRQALGPHAIPDPDDEKIIRDVAEVGAKHILDRRKGGKIPTPRAEIRRLLISIIFEYPEFNLPPRLRKTPTSPATLKKVWEILKQCGLETPEGTILNDVKKIGSRNLRQQ